MMQVLMYPVEVLRLKRRCTSAGRLRSFDRLRHHPRQHYSLVTQALRLNHASLPSHLSEGQVAIPGTDPEYPDTVSLYDVSVARVPCKRIAD